MSDRFKSVYVTLGGGLGDVFYTYKKGQKGWGYIQSLKERHPQVKVKALCATHNPQTLEFIKYNPYIDEAIEYGWVLDGNKVWPKMADGAVRLKNQKELIKKLKSKTPKIYISPNDKKILDPINSSDKEFVLVHPFAGEPHRSPMNPEEFIPVIDYMIDQKNLNVVVIGASYDRTNKKFSEPKKEEFSYQRDGLFNLVGNLNSRIGCVLARDQKFFIGSWSAYSCASWLYGKTTNIILQDNTVERLEKKIADGQRWENASCNIITTKGPSHKPRGTNYSEVRKQLKRYVDLLR